MTTDGHAQQMFTSAGTIGEDFCFKARMRNFMRAHRLFRLYKETEERLGLGEVVIIRAEAGRIGTEQEGNGVLAAKKDRADQPQGEGGLKRSQKSASGTKEKGQQGHVGNSLRSVYEKTVEEPVPPEFLDLLGKLA